MHGDVKPDNLLLRRDARGGWGLRLIDFGRAVDLDLLPAGFALRGDSEVKGYRCRAMQAEGAWLHEADSHGVACCAQLLLHTGRLPLRLDGAGRPRDAPRRYWQAHLWGPLLARLVGGAGPVTPDQFAPAPAPAPPRGWRLIGRGRGSWCGLEEHLAAGGTARSRQLEKELGDAF